MLRMVIPEKIKVMLVKFSVSNFKNFKEKIELYLTSPCDYDYNSIAVDDGVVTKAVLYGPNGSGKTNLALAIFDIVIHLTDNARDYHRYEPYLNMDSKESYAEFEYTFLVEGREVVYDYAKSDARTLVYERLTIDGREVLYYDFKSNKGKVDLKGAEHLDLSAEQNHISRVKYVMSNAILYTASASFEDKAFLAINAYVDRMLMFQALDEGGYQGMLARDDDCIKGIIRDGEAKGFENFLRNNGIDYNLDMISINGEKDLCCRFGNGDALFRDVASTGTSSMAAFYYWYRKMGDASFVYIDEFDAFYHFELAERIVESLKNETGAQILLSTHNTDLLSNDLLRPDCYFVLRNGSIKSLDKLTDKELRKAHNIQKMYKAGSFDE